MEDLSEIVLVDGMVEVLDQSGAKGGRRSGGTGDDFVEV